MPRWDVQTRKLRNRIRKQVPDITPGSAYPSKSDYDAHYDDVSTIHLRRGELRPPLFDYQRALKHEIIQVIRLNNRGLLSLPTGAGKTRTAVAAVLDATRLGIARAVAWLAPSLELVQQARRTFQDLWFRHGTAPDMILSHEPMVHHSVPVVWLTTPQAVYSRTRHARNVGVWSTVIFDEAHQLGARTFRSAVTQLMSASWEAKGLSPTLLGLSATPGRLDPEETEDLVDLFEGQLLKSELLKPNPIQALQRRGVLARLKFRQLTEATVPLNDTVTRTIIAARASNELARRGRKVIVFASSVPQAIVLAETVNAAGSRSLVLHSALGLAERLHAIKSFEQGDTEVLVNHRILATGYDCPAISDLILAGPITSTIQFEQIVGRAARGPRTGGAGISNIWEFDDHLAAHGLPQSYYRYRDFDWD